MRTVVIEVDNKLSAKLFTDLAKKLHFKSRVLTEQEKEDLALLCLINEHKDDPTLPIESTYKILDKNIAR